MFVSPMAAVAASLTPIAQYGGTLVGNTIRTGGYSSDSIMFTLATMFVVVVGAMAWFGFQSRQSKVQR